MLLVARVRFPRNEGAEVTRKRDIKPETVLQALIPPLEREDFDVRTATRTLRWLLVNGPLRCPDDSLEQFATWASDPMALGGTYRELLKFLRDVVRLRDSEGRGPKPRIWTDGVTQSVRWERGRLVPAVEGGPPDSVRTLLVLQFRELLLLAGVNNIRKCSAPDCDHLFVKVYRREFCSERCQKRVNKRALRQQARNRRQKPPTRDTAPPARRVPPDRDLPVYLTDSARAALERRKVKGRA